MRGADNAKQRCQVTALSCGSLDNGIGSVNRVRHLRERDMMMNGATSIVVLQALRAKGPARSLARKMGSLSVSGKVSKPRRQKQPASASDWSPQRGCAMPWVRFNAKSDGFGSSQRHWPDPACRQVRLTSSTGSTGRAVSNCATACSPKSRQLEIQPSIFARGPSAMGRVRDP